MIKIRNIYYMLAYAFKVLNGQGYRNIATEEFENAAELCAEILIHGVSSQIKRGLQKEYIPKTELLSSLRGRIDISESVKVLAFYKKHAVCSYDDFSVNSYMNRIIKSTIMLLLRSDITKARKKKLRKLSVFFDDVNTIDLDLINWNLNYNRNNQTYQMLISICYLIIKGLLQTQSDGTKKLMDFLDEQRMNRLYEKFILEYYRKEFPQVKVNASQIFWQLDDEVNAMLPVMKTDVMLTYSEKILIIDAKYYSHSTQINYNKHTIHSGNMYQIFTYVKNKETELADKPHEVSGMLLYAKTDEDIYPENEYRMSGNKIAVRTLNLDSDFAMIKEQLNSIAKKYLLV